MSHRLMISLIALIALTAHAPAVRAGSPDVTIEVAAAGGQSIPDYPDPFRLGLGAFTTVRIGHTGVVEFIARHAPPDDPVYSALWLWTPGGGLEHQIHEGPFEIGTTYVNDIEESSRQPVSDSGEVLLHYQLWGVGINFDNDERIARVADGVVTDIAVMGSPLPGTPHPLDSLSAFYPLFNGAGGTAFIAQLGAPAPTTANAGIWYFGPLGDTLHALEGDAAPGFDAGDTFFAFRQVISINDFHEIFMRIDCTGPGIDSSNDHGLYLGLPGAAPTLVAREGDPVPGVAGDVNYGGFQQGGSLNNVGGLAFYTTLVGADVTLDDNTAIIAGTVGNLSMAMRRGDLAPGAGGATFTWVDEVVIDSSGRLAFKAGLTGAGVDGANNEGIWQGPPGALELVARLGDPTPDADPGDVFDTVYPPFVNTLGQIAFNGRFENGATTGWGVWAADTDGTLHTLLRTGDMIEVEPGDTREVSEARLHNYNGAIGGGGQDGQPMNFNDAGQAAMLVRFTDGSEGVVRATLGDTGVGPGDIDGDGDVDTTDLLALLAAWGVCPGCPEDLDGNGTVDVSDLLALLASWS